MCIWCIMILNGITELPFYLLSYQWFFCLTYDVSHGHSRHILHVSRSYLTKKGKESESYFLKMGLIQSLLQKSLHPLLSHRLDKNHMKIIGDGIVELKNLSFKPVSWKKGNIVAHDYSRHIPQPCPTCFQSVINGWNLPLWFVRGGIDWVRIEGASVSNLLNRKNPIVIKMNRVSALFR